MKKKIEWLIAGSVSIICISLLLDFFDVPSKIGIPMDSVNWDAISLIVGNLLVILIAVITYLLIDKRNREKEKNQREIAVYTLQNIYEQCLFEFKKFDHPKYVEYAKKCFDNDDPDFQKAKEKFLYDGPYDAHSDIVEFAKNGIISKNEYQTYLEIKKEHYTYVLLRLVFYDDQENALELRNDVISKIKKARNELKGGL